MTRGGQRWTVLYSSQIGLLPINRPKMGARPSRPGRRPKRIPLFPLLRIASAPDCDNTTVKDIPADLVDQKIVHVVFCSRMECPFQKKVTPLYLQAQRVIDRRRRTAQLKYQEYLRSGALSEEGLRTRARRLLVAPEQRRARLEVAVYTLHWPSLSAVLSCLCCLWGPFFISRRRVLASISVALPIRDLSSLQQTANKKQFTSARVSHLTWYVEYSWSLSDCPQCLSYPAISAATKQYWQSSCCFRRESVTANSRWHSQWHCSCFLVDSEHIEWC